MYTSTEDPDEPEAIEIRPIGSKPCSRDEVRRPSGSEPCSRDEVRRPRGSEPSRDGASRFSGSEPSRVVAMRLRGSQHISREAGLARFKTNEIKTFSITPRNVDSS